MFQQALLLFETPIKVVYRSFCNFIFDRFVVGTVELWSWNERRELVPVDQILRGIATVGCQPLCCLVGTEAEPV